MKKDICGPLRSPLCVMKTDIWSLFPPNREQECAKAISIAHCLHSVKWSGDQFRYSRLEFGYPYLIPVTCEQILWRIHNPDPVALKVVVSGSQTSSHWHREYAPRFRDAKCVNIFWTDPWQGTMWCWICWMWGTRGIRGMKFDNGNLSISTPGESHGLGGPPHSWMICFEKIHENPIVRNGWWLWLPQTDLGHLTYWFTHQITCSYWLPLLFPRHHQHITRMPRAQVGLWTDVHRSPYPQKLDMSYIYIPRYHQDIAIVHCCFFIFPYMAFSRTKKKTLKKLSTHIVQPQNSLDSLWSSNMAGTSTK